mgnify:CR=1 FL=1
MSSSEPVSMDEPTYGTDPRKLARKGGMDTSKDAAEKVNSSRLEEEVYKVILGSGPRGMISDEVRNSMPHVSSYSSVTARYKALKEKKLIVATADRRPGVSGRNQSVLVASAYIRVPQMSIAPWSFSKIKAFEQCPKQFYHMKVLKEFEDKETEAMRYGTLMHEAAEKYVQDNTPLHKSFKYVQPSLDSLIAIKGEKLCEFKMGLTASLEPCEFDADDVWWRGIADLVILDTDNHLAWIIDYKTGKSTRYADKGQLELMALAVFKHFPVVETVKAGLLVRSM